MMNEEIIKDTFQKIQTAFSIRQRAEEKRINAVFTRDKLNEEITSCSEIMKVQTQKIEELTKIIK